MKTHNNFYTFFRELMPEITRLKNGAQIVSGLTAAVGIWYIVAPRLAGFHWVVSAIVAALLVALSIAIIEGGLRKIAPFAVRQVVWYNFENKWWIIMYVPVLIVTMGLMVSTTTLSWFASPEIIQQVAPDADTTNTYEITTSYDLRRAQIIADYQKQKEAVKIAIASQEKAITDKYDTRSKNYTKRAKNEDRPNEKKYLLHLSKKEANKKKSKITELTASQSEQFATIDRHQLEALATLDKERSMIVGGAIASNTTALQRIENGVQKWGRFLAWFSLCSGLLFLFCVVLDEVYKRGSHDTPPEAVPLPVVPVSNTNEHLRQGTRAQPPGTKPTQETVQNETAKKQYTEAAKRARVYWKRYKAQPETETGRANEERAREQIAILNDLGYKAVVKPDDKTKLIIKPK